MRKLVSFLAGLALSAVALGQTQQLISNTPGSATTAPAAATIINSNFGVLWPLVPLTNEGTNCLIGTGTGGVVGCVTLGNLSFTGNTINGVSTAAILPPGSVFCTPSTNTGAQAAVGCSNIPSSALPIAMVYVPCTNTSTDQAYLTAALATGYSVMFSGSCALSTPLTVASGQYFGGQGKYATKINITSSFQSSATGIVVCNGTCDIENFEVVYSQPGIITANSAANYSSGASTITVASLTGTGGTIVSGDYVYDSTGGATAIPVLTTISSITGSGPYTLNLSANVGAAGVSTSDTLQFTPTRSQFSALGTCSATVPCQYPPAVYDVSVSSRPKISHIATAGAWACLDFTGGSVVNIAPEISDLMCDAVNYGIRLDGAQDSVPITDVNFYPYGWGGAASRAYSDGSTEGILIGRVDGLDLKGYRTFQARAVFTSNFGNSGTPSSINDMHLDGNGANLEISGGAHSLGSLQISNLYRTGTTLNAQCPINVTAGYVTLVNADITQPGSTTSSEICMTGGLLRILDSSLTVGNGNYAYASKSGSTASTLDLSHDAIEGGVNLTDCLVSDTSTSTSGGTVVQNNYLGPDSTAITGCALSITTDTVGNLVAGNDFRSLTYSMPTGSNGIYSLAIPVLSALGQYVAQTGGSSSNPAYTFTGATTTGIYTAGNAVELDANGNNSLVASNTSVTINGSLPIKPGYFLMNSTAYTFASNSCGATVTTGDAAGGQYTSGTTGTCAVTVTLPTTSTHWNCFAYDYTTSADYQQRATVVTQTLTITGTTVSGDVIAWDCIGH